MRTSTTKKEVNSKLVAALNIAHPSGLQPKTWGNFFLEEE
jgi:hypothetical protein